MSIHRPPHPSLCVTSGVEPLVTELTEEIDIFHARDGTRRRERLERFIRSRFRRAYGAQVDAFCPHMLGFFNGARRLRAAVGYRDGTQRPLFLEQYLDLPAERLVARHFGQPVAREQLVEVGNLALARAGYARWVIAATTAYLHAAGYRWVVFTAVAPLLNAFQRLGLRPLALADADPERLPDGGAAWGRYYDSRPKVYAGDIAAGLGKLIVHTSLRQSPLTAVLVGAADLGTQIRHDKPRTAPQAAAVETRP